MTLKDGFTLIYIYSFPMVVSSPQELSSPRCTCVFHRMGHQFRTFPLLDPATRPCPPPLLPLSLLCNPCRLLCFLGYHSLLAPRCTPRSPYRLHCSGRRYVRAAHGYHIRYPHGREPMPFSRSMARQNNQARTDHVVLLGLLFRFAQR